MGSVVDGWSVASNIAQTVAYLAATPLLWLFLYLFAWDDASKARAAGFGRTTFWLLVLGGILGYLGDLPFVPIGRYVLGINVAGGIIPLVLSAIFLSRLAPRSRTYTLPFLGLLAGETTAALVAVILLPAGFATFGVLVVAVIVTVLAAGQFGGTDRTAHVFGAAFALVSAGIVVSFLVTSTDAGYGITSEFPFYLLAPLGMGVAAVAVAERLRFPSFVAFPLAYATATIGVLVGADVLRQPPLYGPGAGLFYVIGGGGPFDLLYLSGPIALVAAWAFDRAVHRVPGIPAPDVPHSHVPEVLLRGAVQLAVGGDPATAARLSGEAADAALDRARLLAGVPVPPADMPWAGFRVPAWVNLDHRNLRALVTSPERRPRDAARAWWTARWIVRLARDVSRARFARSGTRLGAGIVDFVVLAVPAFVAWVAIVLWAGLSTSVLLSSAWFNAAAVGYSAWGFVYFVVAESAFGTTVGKRWFGLIVTDRSLRRPKPLAALLRNLPKLVPLFVVGVIGADIVFLALRGAADLALGPVGVIPYATAIAGLVTVLVLGVGIPTAAGGLAISWTAESQRVGDVLAGTWVVTERPLTAPPPLAAASPPAAVRSA